MEKVKESLGKILFCNCDHKFQDKTYGTRKRLHNPCAKGFRCTVCAKVKAG